MAVLAFVVAQLVVLLVPLKMHEPDDWGFKYAARNFASGQLTLNDEQYVRQYYEVADAGGQFWSYGSVGGGHWAFTMAPGYAFYIAPFERAGIPQLGASLLSLGLAAILYLFLTRLKDEKTALFGVVLLVFEPLYLAMWQRVYIDAFAALAFCGVGGGLYLYYWLSRTHLSARMSAAVLFAAGFLLMASVSMRYTNIAIVVVFGIHFLVMALRSHLQRQNFLPTGFLFGVGMMLPLAGLLIYHGIVFGSPFSFGGEFAQVPERFAWNYGAGIGYNIVRGNVIQLWAPLIVALPIIIAAIPSFGAVAYGKGFFSRRLDTWPELPAHTYHVLLGWMAIVFGLYVMYEFTSYQAGGRIPFPLLTRFYLPALLPLVIITALMFRRLSVKIWGSAIIALTVLGIIFFIQVAQVQTQFVAKPAPPSPNISILSKNTQTVATEEFML